jgi:hypothetical protein
MQYTARITAIYCITAACAPPNGGAVTPEEVTVENFCAKYAPARAEALERCWGGWRAALGPAFDAGEKSACDAAVASRSKALSASRLAFGADAARTCLNALRIWDCQYPLVPPGDFVYACDFDRVFAGAVQPGGVCFGAGECEKAKGWCDKDARACSGQCVAWRALGETCAKRDFQKEKPDTCDPALGFCGGALKCLAWSENEVSGGCGFTDKRCNPFTQFCGVDKVCRAILREGDVCRSGGCEAGLECRGGVCTPPGAEGATCTPGSSDTPLCQPDLECLAASTSEPPTCIPRLGAEFPCGNHAHCEGDFLCFNKKCTVPAKEGQDCEPAATNPNPLDPRNCERAVERCEGSSCRLVRLRCDPGGKKCTRLLAKGEECNPGADLCDAGIWCKPPDSGAAVCATLPVPQEPCGPRGCSSGYCATAQDGNDYCFAPQGLNASCESGDQCQSGRCIDHACAQACSG